MEKRRERGEAREGKRADGPKGVSALVYLKRVREGGRETGAQGYFAARRADLSRASCVSKCDESRGFTSFLRSRHRKAPPLYVLKESVPGTVPKG
jgi:hypothetical protein